MLVFCSSFACCQLFVSTLFLSSCLPSGLPVRSLCGSISWTYHRITNRTSKQQPCPRGSAFALSACLFRFRFFIFFIFFPYLFSFLSSFCSLFVGVILFLFSLFFFFFFVSSVHKIPWIRSRCYFIVNIVRDGMIYHNSLVPFPLRARMILPCAHYQVCRICLFFAIETHFCYSLVFTTYMQDFREVS